MGRRARRDPPRVEGILEWTFPRIMDRLVGWIPRPRPDRDEWARCRLVSHRGECSGEGARENTLEAFRKAQAEGVWGIECDVRWTRDLCPVVLHDPDLRRVYGLDITLGDVDFETLRRRCPAVPSLEEVIDEFGGTMHLMVEFKEEPYPEPGRQSRILGDLFSRQRSGRDYHLLSLAPEMFRLVTWAPPSACLPVAGRNVRLLSRVAADRGYAGIAGHYALISGARIRAHRRLGQEVGTGYVASRRCLWREVARGVTWFFSNHACAIQRILDRERPGGPGMRLKG